MAMANHPLSPLYGKPFSVDRSLRLTYRCREYAAARVDADEAAQQDISPAALKKMLAEADVPEWIPRPSDSTGWPLYERYVWEVFLSATGRKHDGRSRHFVPRSAQERR